MPISIGYRTLLPYARKIYDPANRCAAGYIVAYLNEAELTATAERNLCSGTQQTDDFIIIDNGKIISSWHKEMIGKDVVSVFGRPLPEEVDFFDLNIFEQRKAVVRYTNPPVSDWIFLATAPYHAMYADNLNLIVFLVGMLVAFLVVVIFVSTLLAKVVTRPLAYLTTAMSEVGEKRLQVQLNTPQYHDEIGILWHKFIEMTDLLRESQKETELAWERNKDLTYSALIAQINPHFIYNTFNSIIWLIENEHTSAAIQMIMSLSDLLRISISKKNEFISVREEVRAVQHYMEIQKFRFKNNFDYIIDIPSEMLPENTVKIVLQPIVENAFEHGIRNLGNGKGLIKILGRITDTHLCFDVYDNGNSLTDEKMAEVNRYLSLLSSTDRHRRPPSAEPDSATRGSSLTAIGIGLSNVHERIRYYFPADPDAGVRLDKSDGYTIARISIPRTNNGVE